jgi:hypothetical protein
MIIIAVFVVFTAVGMLIRYVECKLKMRKDGNFKELFWKILRFQLMQSEDISFRLLSGRVALLIFSIFQISIMIGLFQGLILSNIIRVSLDLPNYLKSFRK